jgi:hypothetical protein
MVSTTTARAASFGNPDQPAEGAVNVTNPKALTDPGPKDPGLAGNEPAFSDPPATDVNGMPQFWTSFNLAPRRIQNGGWARQITEDDFKISTTIATCASAQAAFVSFIGPAGGMGGHDLRQLPVTILDQNGRPEVADVKEGAISGTSRRAFRIHYRAWIPMAAILSSPSITVIHPNSTPCWSPTGLLTPRQRCASSERACASA